MNCPWVIIAVYALGWASACIKGPHFILIRNQIDLLQIMRKIINGYKDDCKTALLGEYGKTDQYWFNFGFINLYQHFPSSVRYMVIKLYKYSIYNMSDLFFSLNQSNYARLYVGYTIIYPNNLKKAQNSNLRVVSEQHVVSDVQILFSLDHLLVYVALQGCYFCWRKFRK